MAKRPKSFGAKSKTKTDTRKQVRVAEGSIATDSQTICWQFNKGDWNGPWGYKALNTTTFPQFVGQFLSKLDSMTWAEIYSATGGRKQGNNNHPVKVSDLSKKAKSRLKEINLGDIDDLVSIRVSGKARIYGIREGRIFQFLWFDPWHDEPSKAVYPSKR